ncbi:hypothetical protein ElyMa_003527200 [Elysia marginata]|uniref:Uncharacterized protein n=1 Tax=Elysia marginata TaxID=1093978 RepID=A0AAV4EHV5_9GAST|nr:hypothetical protein ElyMa_003527200 [Elysia marginata]
MFRCFRDPPARPAWRDLRSWTCPRYFRPQLASAAQAAGDKARGSRGDNWCTALDKTRQSREFRSLPLWTEWTPRFIISYHSIPPSLPPDSLPEMILIATFRDYAQLQVRAKNIEFIL